MRISFLTLCCVLFVTMTASAAVSHSGPFGPQVGAFLEALESLGVSEASLESTSVSFASDKALPSEGYRVEVQKDVVQVHAADPAAAAYAAADLVRRAELGSGAVSWEQDVWEEAPDFPYRSFLVDMGRNPHSPKTLRHLVDMMWFYRGNYLQLHLTDDQLFSWPSQAYPELYSERAGWILEDFRELEAYSQARGVTLVPELEVPGHSSILRGRRPDVFGETTLALATTEEAQDGVETLIAEMLEVFQATPYVHIGADEVHGVPQDEQRKFINRLNRFVREQGRTTVVWEGPAGGRVERGETKVDTNVIHMAWEGRYYPMPEMVDAGYRIVNASWDPFYVVDHYPRNNFTGVPLERIYNVDLRRLKNVDPGLPSFHRPQWIENTDSVLGFLMPWWEGRESNVLALCVQRFGAAASRAWDYDAALPYEAFAAREADLLERLEMMSGFELPETPMASAEDAQGNLAYGAKVEPSRGASQPHFVPERLTNGITEPFDLFLGFPTKPEPLVIDIQLQSPLEASRIRVHEMAVGNGWEKYRLFVSADGQSYEKVAETTQGARGEERFIDHRFDARPVMVVRIETDGFESFTFPSFSRLTEVEVFAE